MSPSTGRNDRQGVFLMSDTNSNTDPIHVVVPYAVMTRAQKYRNVRDQETVAEAYWEAIELPVYIPVEFDDIVVHESVRAATPREIDSTLYPLVIL